MRLGRRAALAIVAIVALSLGVSSVANADPRDNQDKPAGSEGDRASHVTGDAGFNDNIGNAHVFAHRGGRFFDSNVGATLQYDWNGRMEPVIVTENGPNEGGASIWYKLTPCATGPVEINTFGSSWNQGSRIQLDTILGVFKGQQLRQLQQVAGNDDASARGGHQGYTSRVRVNLVRGRTYHIVVDGYNWPGVNPYSSNPAWQGDPAGEGPEEGLVRILARSSRPCRPGGAGPNR